ncbi:hypothetical protein BH10ACI3_BH10ACI3_09760 [soil metagenome]
MNPPRTRKRLTFQNSQFALAAGAILLVLLAVILWFWVPRTRGETDYRYVTTVAGTKSEIGEPFGVAVRGRDIFVSDGQNGKIWRINVETVAVFAEGLDTPSGIAFDQTGNLIIADAGSNTIKSVESIGRVTTLAGTEGKSGFADGDALAALFNAPIGVAIDADGKIYVADTYNDRVRVIANGKVSTLAGSTTGYADGMGEGTKFDTPSGIAVWQNKLLVADTGNRRIRVIEPDGRVWTLAGTGEYNLKDGLLAASTFVEPTAVTVDTVGRIFVADGNAIRQIGGVFPYVRTISAEHRGVKDGAAARARFNRPSGLGIDSVGNLIVSDSENRLVRKFSHAASGHTITVEEIAALRDTPEEFRQAQPARWPYDPATAKRDIAGTLGELRGEVKPGNDDLHFHNGLDIAGSYGETARFVRDEKVLRPITAENFGTLRELIRMPTLGYIHIRLGRNVSGVPFGDERFQFEKDGAGKLTGIRVPRGSKFKAGEPIGTLNPMNHVHLIAGRSGSEMNALDALILPGIADSRPPVIDNISVFDENWKEFETKAPNGRITIRDRIRIVVRAYDQVDGNNERRRLGVYRLGYQLLKGDAPLADPKWTITFDRLPAGDSIKLVYANGSKSGATGDTIFNYIVTDLVDGDNYKEDMLNTATLENGIYTLRVFAADHFGNTSHKDLTIGVNK